MFKSIDHPSDEHGYTTNNILEKCCMLFDEMFNWFDRGLSFVARIFLGGGSKVKPRPKNKQQNKISCKNICLLSSAQVCFILLIEGHGVICWVDSGRKKGQTK